MQLKKVFTRAAGVLLATAGLTVAASASAAGKQTLCVWDVTGTQGDVFNLMKDYKLAATRWGADLELRPYTDEKIASEDFKAGQCDAVMMTGLRGRQFNAFTGSLDSLGSMPSYEHVRKVLATLAKPNAASLMVSGNYEVGGIAPMGAAYLFVNDRSINNVGKLSGKKVAVLDYDKAQAKMAQKVGMQPVASDITNFAGKFNNGSVDIVGAPAAAFKPLELFKGLGTKGAIVQFPLVQVSLQLYLRKDRFPEGFGQKSREYMFSQYERAQKLVVTAEKEIDKKYWMQIPTADQEKYNQMIRESRIALTNEGIYDKRTMKMLKQVRCSITPSEAECSQNLE
ncbi:MAG TPA: putative solute-binding protein [Moraxellaceae bacterium]|nr:putative solute-binding protein [Moraxellaceae bacterium]